MHIHVYDQNGWRLVALCSVPLGIFNIYDTETHGQKELIFFCGTDEPEGGYNTLKTLFQMGFIVPNYGRHLESVPGNLKFTFLYLSIHTLRVSVPDWSIDQLLYSTILTETS